jgi:hypothetical protein
MVAVGLSHLAGPVASGGRAGHRDHPRRRCCIAYRVAPARVDTPILA